MDGFEFLAEMHRRDESKSIPVIVITARELSEEDRARLNGNVTRVLQKSLYDREELLEQVGRLIVDRMEHRSSPTA
jgi:CheY-like chemotaxis protein